MSRISPQKTLPGLSRESYVSCDEIYAEPLISLLKRHYPVVTGQINYVYMYLDEIHTESLVSLLKRHYPGCHGTGKLCLP
jgi:hypothetical protein